ncbi:MAG: hypothetical protein K2N64_06460 [Anaeroplasmataceae bacterium]|nr:hypothetical protein [Anaeroplasmataceae bacterium]
MYKFLKLNEHSEYLKILNILEQKTKYIEYVLVDESDTWFINALQEDIYEQKKVNHWWGTKTSQRCCLYKIKASTTLFSILRKFSTFCVMKSGEWGDYTEATDFGINDIAFFDDRTEPILFTTTHEGYIEIREDIK